MPFAMNSYIISPPRVPILLLPLIIFLLTEVDSSEMRMSEPKPPQEWNLYIAVAFSEAHAQTFSRAFNKTLNNVTKLFTENYHQQNITLTPLLITLPENEQFSAAILEKACTDLEGKPVAAVMIVGASPAGFAVSLAADTAGIPVLWARGGTGEPMGHFHSKRNSLEVRLEPSVREMLEAVRALLLATHWHSFTVLADSSASSGILLRRDVSSILKTPPLNPTLLVLRSGAAARHSIFRQLAEVSRATRGVILILCDLQTAKQITSEAKRLNMMSGHFVWLWIDTSTSTTITNTNTTIGANLTSSTFVPKRRDPTSNKPNFSEGPRSSAASDILLRSNNLRLGDLLSFRDSDSWLYQDKNGSPSERFPDDVGDDVDESLPIGLLALKAQAMKVDKYVVNGAVHILAHTLHKVLAQCEDWNPAPVAPSYNVSCWTKPTESYAKFSHLFVRELRATVTDVLAGRRLVDEVDKSLVAAFDILNLVPEKSTPDYDNNNLGANDSEGGETWKQVGEVTGRAVRLDTIVWPGGDLVVAGLSARARSVFRIVTALAPPFVMEGELDEDGQCLRGIACHRVLTSDKDNLTLVFNEMETNERLEEEEVELVAVEEDLAFNSEPANAEDIKRRTSSSAATAFELHRYKYRTNCCYGLAMDLLENVAQELEFDFHLYIVADGLFGTKTRDSKAAFHSKKKSAKWNGIVGDLVSGAAHMSFAALSVSSTRSEVIDFSVPYFFSGVSFLAAPTQKSEIPLLAFLLPFSPELWIAIFTSLNITAMAVAVYEWLSPFGLNPWGRQRSKNFSIASALWVMWGLLCGHLVAFKAPKSWPNKFLINVWGGFSVIFVASYTANIAALIAGLFFHNAVSNYHDRSLLSQRVGAPRASAADYYVHRANQHLWEHMQKFIVRDMEEGIQHLKNGTLDILIADTPILDYYRATDHGCKLQKIGDAINEDTYAVGMSKGFPLKDSISAVIAKYSSNGYMDILQEKWYGALPCFKLATDMAQPRPLGVAAVAGVFILLGLGMVLGCLILLFEHLFYRYTLPILRHQPKGTIWRSRNIMFFSQKLYRFINCVELVSPHHAARELVHTIRQGQITSLFQKSVKRKEHEQRRRRKSKAQFFEMIQEIRRYAVQQEERDQSVIQEEDVPEPMSLLKPGRRTSKDLLSPLPSKTSPRKIGKLKSPRALEARKFCKEIFSPSGSHKAINRRRFSTDMIFSPLRSRLECPSNAVGRRLSKDSGGCNSPPDINSRRFSNLDVSARQEKLSSLDVRFQQGKSNLDVRSNLNTLPKLGTCSKFGARRLEVSSVQERLNTIGSRLGSLSTTDISCRSHRFSRSRSRSPIPSMFNVSLHSPTDPSVNVSTIPKYRDRVRSDTNARDAIQGRPKLRTPSPTEIQVDVVQHRELNSTSGRSKSLDNSRSSCQEEEIKPASEPEMQHQHQKLKRSDYILPYESIIEVNVTCCDSTPKKVVDKPSRSFDKTSTSQEQINESPSPYSSLRKAQFRRRQSHQPRLETVYTPQHQIISPTSSSQSSTKEFLLPIQHRENSSSSSSSRSPVRRRHQSHPIPQDKLPIAPSSSIPDVSIKSPNRQRHYHHHRHRSRDSSHECDEVFDDIPPPPPPPQCQPRNGSNGESPLDRLNKEELVALWRSSESELRSHLLRAIRAKEVTDPP